MADFSVNMYDSLEDDSCEKAHLEKMVKQDMDGLILLPVGKQWKHIQQLARSDTAMVVVDRIMPDLDCHCVGVDNYTGGFDAVDYLIERGHSRIACIQRLPDSWINDQRIAGYRGAHKKHGLKTDVSLIVGREYGQRNGYLETKRLLQRKNAPTAFFALSHLCTLGAMRAFREHRIAVGKDISLHNEGEDWMRWPTDGKSGNIGRGHDYNIFWPPEQVVDFLKFMRPMMDEAGLEEVGITPGECTNWYRFSTWGYADAIADDKAAIKNLGLITSHGFYSGSYGRWFGGIAVWARTYCGRSGRTCTLG